MPLFKSLREFYSEYEMPLAAAMHEVEKRGLLVDRDKLAKLAQHIDKEITEECDKIATATGQKVFADPSMVPFLGKTHVNLNAPAQVVKLLESLGLTIPLKRGTGRKTTDEASLFRLFSDTGNPVLQSILRIRELNKIGGTYVRVELLDDTLYCSYVVAGTVTGRRSSRANYLGLGTNHQNLPKHSKLGEMYRECIISRPGKIFVACDQKGAEDWIVQGLIADASGVMDGINELHSGVNRHRKLASFLFSLPELECHKNSVHYYLGKKIRHAGQYDMRGVTMSQSLASEQVALSPAICDAFLQKFHEHEPQIKQVFHAYVKEQLMNTRTLTTPIGRSRYFFSLRPYSDNSAVFREAYAYIPQSTIGDNTGLAILHCETKKPGLAVADGHDAVYLEVDDNDESIMDAVALLQEAFDRELTFQNGFQIKIPVEVEVGYSLSPTEMRSCDNLSMDGLKATLATLKRHPLAQEITTTGVLQPQLQQP